MEALGRLVGVPTPLTTAVIELAQALLGRDLRARARTPNSLGLGGLSLGEVKEMVDEKGWWSECQ